MLSKTSRLGFGLSSIAGSGNFAHQQDLIRTAIDCGVTHFDVAPYYGSGDAERILGKILQGCKDQVSITTKYGLMPFKSGKGGSLIRNTLRPVFRKVKVLKSIATAVMSRTHEAKPIVFDEASVLLSIDDSINKLQRPIDFFLLHDASEEFAQNSGVIDVLNEIRNSQKASFTGISGAFNIVAKMTSAYPETYTVAQLENSITDPASVTTLYNNCARVFTHRAIQGGIGQLEFLIKQRPGFSQVLCRELGIDINNKEIIPLLLIELALNENENGTVLFSTTRPARIQKISRVLTSPLLGDEGCKKFRDLLSAVQIVATK